MLRNEVWFRQMRPEKMAIAIKRGSVQGTSYFQFLLHGGHSSQNIFIKKYLNFSLSLFQSIYDRHLQS